MTRRAACAVLLGSILVAGAEARDPETELARATELRIEKRYGEALEILGSLAKEHAGNPRVNAEARYQRGLIMEQERRHREAREEFAQAAEEFPSAPAAPYALLGVARMHVRLGEHAKAVENCNMLILSYPRHAAAGLLGRGVAEEGLGQLPRASSTYRILLRNLPMAPETHVAREALGRICAALIASESGGTSFEEALARGDCLFDQNSLREAQILYEALLKRDVTIEMKVELYMRMGECLEARGRPRQAERAYRRIVGVAPGTPSAARAQLAIVQNRLDRERWREAIRELKKLTREYPGTEAAARAQYTIGSCYESLRDPHKAKEAYRQVLVMAPQTQWAAQAHASLMRMLERPL